MRAPLTDQQNKIYGFIVEYTREHNYPPTIREIMNNFGYKSNNSVVTHLKNLREKGYITNAGRQGHTTARTLQLVDNVIGDYTVKSGALSKALATLKERHHTISASAVVELLSLLNIRVY